MTRWGVHAGTESASIGEVVAFWRHVEALGYEWISVTDHFYPLSGGDAGSFEAVASQAALACVTKKVRVGVFVYSVGYRHPAVLANAVSTIDHLSNGRVEIGIGAGWYEPEYRAYGLPFEPTAERIDKLEEGVQCLAGLLHEERFAFTGKHFQILDGFVGNRPWQPRVPVWIGGKGEKRILPAAARHADGWDAPLGLTAEEFGYKVQVLKRACEEIGRDPANIRCSTHVAVVRDEEDLKAKFRASYADNRNPSGVLMGSDGEVLDGIRAFEAAGADQILVSGNVSWGTEELERVSKLLNLDELSFGPAPSST